MSSLLHKSFPLFYNSLCRNGGNHSSSRETHTGPGGTTTGAGEAAAGARQRRRRTAQAGSARPRHAWQNAATSAVGRGRRRKESRSAKHAGRPNPRQTAATRRCSTCRVHWGTAPQRRRTRRLPRLLRSHRGLWLRRRSRSLCRRTRRSSTLGQAVARRLPQRHWPCPRSSDPWHAFYKNRGL